MLLLIFYELEIYSFLTPSMAASAPPEDWPRPSLCPGPQDENARCTEAWRAERCKQRMESLDYRDVVCSPSFVLYVDPRRRFFVVNKPAGMYVEDVLIVIERYMEDIRKEREGGGETKRAKFPGGSCHEAFRSLASVEERFQLSHRLDRDTTGCLGVACDKEMNRILSRAFQEGRVKKRYVAHCMNTHLAGMENSGRGWKDWKEWTPLHNDGSAELIQWPQRFMNHSLECHTGHGRSKHGLWRLYTKDDVGRALPGGSKVKEMRTNLYYGFPTPKTMKRHARLREMPSFPVVAEPLTGRTHQIRMHCAQYFPIVGDYKYGYDDSSKDGVELEERRKGYRLHSCVLKLPVGGESDDEGVRVLAPPPSWWDATEWGDYDVEVIKCHCEGL